MKQLLFLMAILVCTLLGDESHALEACTGIFLIAGDKSKILARTIEWGGSNLHSQYVVIPRGYTQQSYTPTGTDGLCFSAHHGYIGMAVEQKEFIVEGINELGLAAGLFYFPGYGKYEDFDPTQKAVSISDFQVVSWILGSCKNLEEVKKAIQQVHIVAIDPRASTVHWRFADPTGRQLVLEIIDGKPTFHENPLGVLTNSPGFEWQLTNLNNYVNLYTGNVPPQQLGPIRLAPFSGGSGFLGLPGDVTPPSRFVRAAFFQSTAPHLPTALDTVLQAFHILNNFDIPIGIEFAPGQPPADIPSATQWTSATDLTHRVLYYRTMYNSIIRSIDLKTINFSLVHYQTHPLDLSPQHPIIPVSIS